MAASASTDACRLPLAADPLGGCFPPPVLDCSLTACFRGRSIVSTAPPESIASPYGPTARCCASCLKGPRTTPYLLREIVVGLWSRCSACRFCSDSEQCVRGLSIG